MAGYIGSTAVSLSTTAANVEGNITVTGNVDGRDVSVDGTKLDTIPIISTSSVASFTAKGDGSSQDGYIQLNCYQNTHGIKLKSPPHSAGASYTLVFPVNDGDSGQFLRTDGSGVLSWGTDATLDNTKLPLAGGAMTGNVTYGDNNKIILGASSDLNIYHDSTQGANVIGGGTSSNLTITSGGNLSLGIAQAELLMVGTVATLSGNTQVKLSSGVVTTLTGTGGVTLDNNGNPKFSTTNTGVAVTGNITVTGTVDSIDIATRDAVLTSTTTTANAALPKAGGAMTGAITTNSTFDGRDVAADGVLATNALPKSGGAVTGDVTFGDNNKAIFGADSDLKISHSGSAATINNNTGDLSIQSDGNLKLERKDGGEDYIHCIADGAVELHHNGSKKIETTATGIDVTGNTIAKGYFASEATNSTNKWLTYTHTDNTFRFNYNGAGADEIVITSGGNVGIATTGTDAKLNINGGANGSSVLSGRSDGGNGNNARFKITAFADGGGANYGGGVGFQTRSTTNVFSEHMRIDSSGNVLVSKTALDYNSVAGLVLRADGLLSSVRSGGNCANFNRLSSDGEIIQLGRATSTVGSIGVHGGSLVIGGGDVGIGFYQGANAIVPYNNITGLRGDAIDLGLAGDGRWKDLFLSGGIQFDSRSNKLDDYELGTWTASPTTGSCTSNTWYIKVGRSVTVAGNIYGFSNRSSSATVIIGTLPFAVASGKSSTGAIIGRYIDNPGYAVYTDGGGTTLTFYNNPSDAAYETMKHADFNNSGADIHFSVTYLAAS